MRDQALGIDYPTLDQGRLVVAPDYLALLRQNDLDAFDKIMALKSGKVMRSVPGRCTVRLELNSISGPIIAYLKRYDPAYLSAKRLFLRLLRWPGSQDEALHEWQMIH